MNERLDARENKQMMELTKEMREELRSFSTPELCDGAGDYKTMDYQIKEMVTQDRIVGTAFTVDAPLGVSGIVPDALELLKPGQVLVVDGKGGCNRSYWGDHRSLCAKMQGAEGVIIDGAMRDIEGCEEVGFPVFARALTPGSAAKESKGRMNVPIVCGDIVVNPGDVVVGDRNGVIVFPIEKAQEIMEKAREKIEKQNRVIDEMKRTGKIIPRVK